ncbi:MAG: hypothetical protein LBR11_11080 [Deltaproteobacteria bacterium]|nr:hypothetical protein [Deltaproteobacteria bacterium]
MVVWDVDKKKKSGQVVSQSEAQESENEERDEFVRGFVRYVKAHQGLIGQTASEIGYVDKDHPYADLTVESVDKVTIGDLTATTTVLRYTGQDPKPKAGTSSKTVATTKKGDRKPQKN